MNHGLLCLLLVFVAKVLIAQDISELERRNGFKDIKLGMLVDSVKGHQFKKDFKEKNEFDAKLFEVQHPAYARIGDVTVDKIELKTYRNLIYHIHILAEKDPRLMKALESIYGQATYDIRTETYFWKSGDVLLKFKSYSKNQLEMIYTSDRIFNLMKEDKEKKVQNIADDF